MNTKFWRSAIMLGVCFAVAQVAVAQVAVAQVAVAQVAVAQVAVAQSDDMGKIVESGQASNEYVTLRLKLVPGSRYRTKQTSRNKMAILTAPFAKQGAQKIEISGDITNVSDFAVLYNNADGTTQLRLTYGETRNDMVMKLNGQTMKLPPNKFAQALVGQSIDMKISPLGQVSEIRGWEKIHQKMLASMKESRITPQVQVQMQKSFKTMFGEDYIRSAMQQSGMEFPENPVRSGSSWMQRVQTNGTLPLVANMKRTFQGRSNGLLSIAENGTLTLGDGQKMFVTGPSSLRMAITGNYSGQRVLEEATGFLRSAQQTQRYTGKANVDTQEQKISMQIFGLVTINVQVEKVQ